ncbi:MAG: AAA family ATPase [Myxococcota bacterium]
MAATTIPAEAARPRVDPARFDFETTDAVSPVLEVGAAAVRLQPRAKAALEVAMATRAPGFHVFASGTPHLGKVETVLAVLHGAAGALPRAADWVYVFDEDEPDRPRPVELPGGDGPRFAKAVADAVEAVRRELPRLARSGRYRKRHADLHGAAGQEESNILGALKKEMRALGFDVRRIEGQLEAVPLARGKPVTKALERLSAKQRAAIEATLPRVSDLVEETNRQLSQAAVDFDAKHATLDREAAREVAARALAPVREAFRAAPGALLHLERLAAALEQHHGLFLRPPGDAPTPPALQAQQPKSDPFLRFQVHVLVTHDEEAGAPVVKESRPSLGTLFGTIAKEVEFGVLTTDFTHLKPGALHRANGGFLVMPARAVVSQEPVWTALKRSLRTREVQLEPDEEPGMSTAQALRPAPLPLRCTVVLTGEVELFEALYDQDAEFRELFGVRADFDDSTPLDAAAVRDATVVLAALVRREGTRPVDASGVARLLEAGLRLAGDQQRLSLEWDRVRNVLVEASHEAQKDASDRVRAVHVRRAEDAARWRSGLHREHLAQDLKRGILRVQVAGEALGQVNALALSTLGDSVVGRPVRVSARVGPGARGLIDVERQAHLSGPVHQKAVLQLSGYLLGRFAREQPLALEATLTFEQSYGPVEGDSASVAELAALLSALADAPVRQALAVSCSLGLDGAAQAVGGATQKVEAFFDACSALGLDGQQGVILSAANAQHLVLRDDVCEAIARGRFHLYTVRHADEALELLLGLPSAEVDARVGRRLSSFVEAVRKLSGR